MKRPRCVACRGPGAEVEVEVNLEDNQEWEPLRDMDDNPDLAAPHDKTAG